MQDSWETKTVQLTIDETSLWFDQQSQRLARWKEEEKGKPSFVASSARACPLWEAVLASPRVSWNDRRRSSLTHVAMNFPLLLFLVFFAPLLLFASQSLSVLLSCNHDYDH